MQKIVSHQETGLRREIEKKRGRRGRGKRERLKEVYGSKVLTFSMMFLHLFERMCSKYRWLRNLVYSFTVPMLCIIRFIKLSTSQFECFDDLLQLHNICSCWDFWMCSSIISVLFLVGMVYHALTHPIRYCCMRNLSLALFIFVHHSRHLWWLAGWGWKQPAI